ncbi:MAG TPA: hypothetical protein VHA30_03770 [Patescibacteria group bacterium]|nr:hypothetical protein [Patescibacteria group bacterium]
MKRLFFGFFLAFGLSATALSAQAAKQIHGTVPELQPLQPAPAGIVPNVSNNIQDNPPAAAASAGGEVSRSAGEEQAPAAEPASMPAAGASRWRVYVLAGLLAAAIIFLIWWFLGKKQHE